MDASAVLLESARVLVVDRAALGIDACEQPEPVQAIGGVEEPVPHAFSDGLEVTADGGPCVPTNRPGGPSGRARPCDAPVDCFEQGIGSDRDRGHGARHSLLPGGRTHSALWGMQMAQLPGAMTAPWPDTV